MDESTMLRRTRAKTPVFSVGQLESTQQHRTGDAAQLLAEHYRSILPARLMTPFVELTPSTSPLPTQRERPHKTIRKIKCQQSLRSLSKLHSRASSISDAETLVGSPSPSSPLSPSHPYYDLKKDHDLAVHVTGKQDDLVAGFDNDMALKICVDLLTSELSAALTKQHPASNDERASGLQVMLMIEAYETVQQHLRQKRYDSQLKGMGEEMGNVGDVERILEYWLKVLYSVYDRSYETSCKGNEEYFPAPLSFGNKMQLNDSAIEVHDISPPFSDVKWQDSQRDGIFF